MAEESVNRGPEAKIAEADEDAIRWRNMEIASAEKLRTAKQ